MFRGANKVTLDAKGRVAMPARYRDTLVALRERLQGGERVQPGGVGIEVTDEVEGGVSDVDDGHSSRQERGIDRGGDRQHGIGPLLGNASIDQSGSAPRGEHAELCPVDPAASPAKP